MFHIESIGQRMAEAEKMYQTGTIAAFVFAFVWLLPWLDRLTERCGAWRTVLKIIVLSVYVLANLRETLLFRKILHQISVRLIPLNIHITMLRKIAGQLAQGTLEWSSLRGMEEIFLNILLYVPLGYLLPWIWPGLETWEHVGRHSADFHRAGVQKRRALLSGRVLLIGAACTLVTELIQLLVPIGVFEVDDLINNMLGCGTGCVLYALAVQAAERVKQKTLRTDE